MEWDASHTSACSRWRRKLSWTRCCTDLSRPSKFSWHNSKLQHGEQLVKAIYQQHSMAINSGFLPKIGCSKQQNREFHDEDTPKSMFFGEIFGNFGSWLCFMGQLGKSTVNGWKCLVWSNNKWIEPTLSWTRDNGEF